MYTHPGGGWSVKPFASRDGSACMRIFRTCLEDFPWRGPWQTHLPPLHAALLRSRALVAVEPQQGVIGFLTLQTGPAYVDHLFVAKDWRLCGVGRGLLQVARHEAGVPLTLDVDAENALARKAYEAMGWKVAVNARPARPNSQVRLISP